MMEPVGTASRETIFELCRALLKLDKPFLVRSEILKAYDGLDGGVRASGALDLSIRQVQEAVCDPPWIYFGVRPRIGRWRYVRVRAEQAEPEAVDVQRYLQVKERRILPAGAEDYALEIDFGPFNREFPKLQEPRSIGRGVEFLNRRLSSELFQDAGRGLGLLLDFLKVHHHRGRQLMINDRIETVQDLRRAASLADRLLDRRRPDAAWDTVAHELQDLGFEPGWGDTVARMRETLSLLSEVLEAPDPRTLETLLARIPMIFSVVVLTPHGYFGQDNVLGRPDTGGQVVYILDQVRALEREMVRRLAEQGLDIEPRILVVTRLLPEADGTTCDQRVEEVHGTRHARILRVPFRDAEGRVVPHWISRFKIWPYLERFAGEVEREIVAELGGRPGLIVGNYSDGNLVASLLSRSLDVTQCNIAHALEKSKYLFSDLYWKQNDPEYHFSCQFTADLIAMNSANFIITSTYQEIAGTEETVGQYESYSSFTMPGLFRVVHGVDMFDPKFNIISPGADADVYFPHDARDRRLTALHEEIETLIFGAEERADARGRLAEPDRPLLFTMARLDKIKNITGLVEWYAKHEDLRRRANLLVVAGHVRAEHSQDAEERAQIGRMHALFDEHGLDDCVRWLGVRLDKQFTGELYRCVADRRGAFVQPALFEAFGLTVIEAMATGLPTFATVYGGPLEIIVDGESGFHIDPDDGAAAADKIAGFLERSQADPAVWDALSRGALERVRARYTWELYAERVMTLSRVYGFWKYVTDLDRSETRRYLDLLYGLQYRPLAAAVPVDGDGEA